MVVRPRLPTWYDINILTGDAECSIASPEVFNVAIYTAVVEASVFDGAGTVANVVARPATLVVVVGVVAESPGLAPLAILSNAIFWSPVVLRDVADGVNVVVDPAGEFPPS
jgi:hypothetical protein